MAFVINGRMTTPFTRAKNRNTIITNIVNRIWSYTPCQLGNWRVALDIHNLRFRLGIKNVSYVAGRIGMNYMSVYQKATAIEWFETLIGKGIDGNGELVNEGDFSGIIPSIGDINHSKKIFDDYLDRLNSAIRKANINPNFNIRPHLIRWFQEAYRLYIGNIFDYDVRDDSDPALSSTNHNYTFSKYVAWYLENVTAGDNNFDDVMIKIGLLDKSAQCINDFYEGFFYDIHPSINPFCKFSGLINSKNKGEKFANIDENQTFLILIENPDNSKAWHKAVKLSSAECIILTEDGKRPFNKASEKRIKVGKNRLVYKYTEKTHSY